MTGKMPRPVHWQRPSASPVEKTSALPSMSSPQTSSPISEKGHAQLAIKRLARLLDGDALAAHDAIEIAHRGPQALDVVSAFKPVQNVRNCIAQFPTSWFFGGGP
ncbi:hypothetical protein [Mesorhizobium amorphae]|uniref:hypothetical protein n=1 Tax=Mesorhizobium amorphae TaxID=71433 RepID=UPI001FD082A1|nr:hypothetical protein [Mesorhizobium amorphae]